MEIKKGNHLGCGQSLPYDIINEYNIFSKMLKIQEKDNYKYSQMNQDLILTLASYKVIYPRKFDLLLSNKGKVAYYLSNEFNEKAKQIICSDYLKEIALIEEILESTAGYSMNFKKYIMRIINDNVGSKYNGYLSATVLNDESKEEICKLSDLDKNILTLIDTKISLKVIDRVSHTSYMEEDEIFNFISKQDLINLIKYSDKYNNSNELNKKKESLENQVNEFNINNYSKERIIEVLDNIKKDELPKEFISERDDDIIYDLNSFEKWMISSENINYKYRQIIIKNHGTTLNYKDQAAIDYIMNSNISQYDIEIVKPKIVLDELSVYDFSKNSICIKSLFEEIINNVSEYNEHLNQFYLNLNIGKIKFILKLEKDGINILKASKKYIEKIVQRISEIELNLTTGQSNAITSEELELFVFTIIGLRVWKNEKIVEFIKGYISTTSYIERKYVDNKNITNGNFKYYKVDFKQDYFNPDIEYTGFYRYLYDNSMINLNYKLISSSTIALDMNFNSQEIISSLASNGDDNAIYKLLFNNIDDTIAMIKKTNIKQKDDEKYLSKFIKNAKLTDEQLEELLSLENIKIKDISLFDNYDLLEKYDLVDCNYYNLNLLFESNNNKLDDYIIEIVNNNIDEFPYEDIKHSDYKDMFDALYESDDITLETFKKLIDYAYKGWHYYTWINEMSDEKNKYMIKIGKMYYSGDDFDRIKKIVNHNTLDDTYKILYLKNSFKYIVNKVYDEMDSITLKYILKMDSEYQKVIDYAYKYENIFDSEIYDLLFNICLNNDINLEGMKLYDILMKCTFNSVKKIQLFNKYNTKLGIYVESLLLVFGNEYKDIISSDKSMKEIPTSKENIKLLDFLVENRYIDHYHRSGRKLLIYYKPKRKRKNEIKNVEHISVGKD